MTHRIQSPFRVNALLIFMLFLLTCEKDKDHGIVLDLTELSSASIDARGGTIEAEGIQVVIPPNAFSSSCEVKLSINNGETDLKSHSVSELYHLDGIPYDFDEPIQVKIKYAKATGEEIRASVLCYAEVKDREDSLMFPFIPVDVIASSDSIVFELAPLPSGSALKSTADDPYGEIIEKLIFDFILTTGWKTESNGTFAVQYPDWAKYDESDVLALLCDFTYALDFYNKLGFDNYQAIERDKPLLIATTNYYLVKNITTLEVKTEWTEKSKPGYYCEYPGLFAMFNEESLASYANEITAAAYRIMGRYEAQVYNANEPNQTWFSYAMGGWSEKEAGFDKPCVFISDEKAGLFQTLIGPWQGCGFRGEFAPLVKYIVKKVEDNPILKQDIHALVRIMGKILLKEGFESVINAISAVLNEDYEIWYPKYIKELMNSSLYDFDPEAIVSNTYYQFENLAIGNTIEFQYEKSDGVADQNWNPLHSRLYRIQTASFTNISSETAIKLSAYYYMGSYDKKATDIAFLAFELENITGKLTFLKTGNEITVYDILELKRNNKDLLIAVVWCPEISTYDPSTREFDPIMKLEVTEETGYRSAHIGISVDASGNYLDNNENCAGKTWYNTDGTNGTPLVCDFNITKITGSVIQAVWNEGENRGEEENYFGSKGEVEMYFSDETLQTLTGFDIKKYTRYEGASVNQDAPGDTMHISFSMSASGLNIKLQYNEEKGWIEGTKDGCTNIVLRYFRKNNYAAFGCHHMEMIQWTCRSDSKLLIQLKTKRISLY